MIREVIKNCSHIAVIQFCNEYFDEIRITQIQVSITLLI